MLERLNFSPAFCRLQPRRFGVNLPETAGGRCVDHKKGQLDRANAASMADIPTSTTTMTDRKRKARACGVRRLAFQR